VAGLIVVIEPATEASRMKNNRHPGMDRLHKFVRLGSNDGEGIERRVETPWSGPPLQGKAGKHVGLAVWHLEVVHGFEPALGLGAFFGVIAMSPNNPCSPGSMGRRRGSAGCCKHSKSHLPGQDSGCAEPVPFRWASLGHCWLYRSILNELRSVIFAGINPYRMRARARSAVSASARMTGCRVLGAMLKSGRRNSFD